jgi:hypothetical protein
LWLRQVPRHSGVDRDPLGTRGFMAPFGGPEEKIFYFERGFDMVNKYNEEAVQKAIDNDKSIGRKEAKLIHAMLKGREKPTRHTITVTSFRGHRKAACSCGARWSPIDFDGTSSATGGNQTSGRMTAHARINNAQLILPSGEQISYKGDAI